MITDNFPENPYMLLTPGPLSTSKSVKAVMLRDWCTWDDDYNLGVVQKIRSGLVDIATANTADYTSVLMQGSGTFSVEATIGSVVPPNGKLLVLANGAYGNRLAQISNRLKIDTLIHDSGEIALPDMELLRSTLQQDKAITHVVVVHCETTTGMLNPIEKIGEIVKSYDKVFIVDAMSSFGGIPIDVDKIGIDFLISSANKCIQGVPGFGFVIARQGQLEKTKGFARSLSLDLYDQWKTMEDSHGKWRYTSPTHTVRAFMQAMKELEEEGGVAKRYERYRSNHKKLVEGMQQLGFSCLLPPSYQSPIITSFNNPKNDIYNFNKFYDRIKENGFVIYPGKVSVADTFRIGNIGHVFPDDIENLIRNIENAIYW
ncbi:2-aminoethylphosphonate--pyruvate transaminase [Fulvivirgaceae bacterium BMA12]|uniref:2-aminoethylphosphonate--pyruvate transaminase n=1 Tax=Agaribacillus aureus TaxID=3051825 RepID=A0ABT8L7E8_9BACT|nr:2-aminoethylphosphonate--pyruvate transaminase [Fulvivirgaceae bacterium BMA12]